MGKGLKKRWANADPVPNANPSFRVWPKVGAVGMGRGEGVCKGTGCDVFADDVLDLEASDLGILYL